MFKNDTKFANFMNALCDSLYIGILWLVCSLPIFTIFASSTAAYYTMSKCVRHRTDYVTKSFFHSFKTNFKECVIINILYLFIGFILTIDMRILWVNESKLASINFVILLLVIFLAASAAVFIPVLLSRFDKGILDIIKFALAVSFRYLYITIPAIVLIVAAVIGVMLTLWGLFFIPGLVWWILSIPFEWILKKLMPIPEEGSIESEAWYYQ